MRDAIFAEERVEFEADYPEVAQQVTHWIDIARRAFDARVDALDVSAATPGQIDASLRFLARLSLVDVAARWALPRERTR